MIEKYSSQYLSWLALSLDSEANYGVNPETTRGVTANTMPQSVKNRLL
jgi:hypothetical protein